MRWGNKKGEMSAARKMGAERIALAVLMALALNLAASADEAVSLNVTADKQTLRPGQMITLTISISGTGGSDLAGYQFAVIKPEGFTCVSHKLDPDFKTATGFTSQDFNSDRLVGAGMRLTSGSGYAGSGAVIMEITFSAGASFSGTADFRLTDAVISDFRGNVIPCVTNYVTVAADQGADQSPGQGSYAPAGSSGDTGEKREEDVLPDEEEPLLIGAWANRYSDVAEADWFYEDVQFVSERGLFSGISETSFSPGAPLTRGMMVTVLYRLAGQPDTYEDNNAFSDLTQDWYKSAVTWAAGAGIVNGIGGGRFAPGDDITRQDAAAIIARYIDYADQKIISRRQYVEFIDGPEIAQYAKEAVMALYCGGIIDGRQGGMFAPRGKATRAEAAAILHRLISQVQ